MPLIDDEALVLDHHPYRDRHLILSVLTQKDGVARGVLRQARGGKAPPAAAAQILSHVHVSLFFRPHAELATFRTIESITSSFPLAAADIERSTAAAVVAELCSPTARRGNRPNGLFASESRRCEALLSGVRHETVVAYVQYWVLALGGVFPAAESETASLNSQDIEFLSACRRHPVSDIDVSPPPSTASWLDTRVREEAETTAQGTAISQTTLEVMMRAHA